MTLDLGMQHLVLRYYQIYSNDDPGLTFTYFTARFNLVSFAFIWENAQTVDFLETDEFYEVKVGAYSQIYEYMTIYDCPRPRSFIDLYPRSLIFNIFKLLFLRNRRLIEAKRLRALRARIAPLELLYLFISRRQQIKD